MAEYWGGGGTATYDYNRITIRQHYTRLPFRFDCVAGVRSENMTESRCGNSTLKGHTVTGRTATGNIDRREKTIGTRCYLNRYNTYEYNVDGSYIGPF